jgi:hypothetical protein
MKINNKELLIITIINILVIVFLILVLRTKNPTLLFCLLFIILIYYINIYKKKLKIIYISLLSAVFRYCLEVISNGHIIELWRIPFWTITSIIIIVFIDCFCIKL